jgi:hypothetical protein
MVQEDIMSDRYTYDLLSGGHILAPGSIGERRTVLTDLANGSDGKVLVNALNLMLGNSQYADALFHEVRRLMTDDPLSKLNESILQQERSRIAENAFDDYDFQDQIVDSDGWEYSTPGEEWTRVFYALNPRGGDSIRKVFVVRFREGSCDVDEAYISWE